MPGDRPSYDFIKGDAPPSVNPSLWRQAKINNINGLFKVTDRIYQVRGYDLSDMSVIEGDTGRKPMGFMRSCISQDAAF